MGRIDRIEEELEELKEKQNPAERKPKFKLPWKVNSLMKQSKKSDYVFVQYLNVKGDIEFRTEKVIQGNVVVIRNKAHVISPKRSWRYGKNTWYLIREIDRYPVSNLDHDLVKRVGRSTDEDVPLIKAVLGATQKTNAVPGGTKTWLLIGLGVVALIAIIYFIKGG